MQRKEPCISRDAKTLVEVLNLDFTCDHFLHKPIVKRSFRIPKDVLKTIEVGKCQSGAIDKVHVQIEEP